MREGDSGIKSRRAKLHFLSPKVWLVSDEDQRKLELRAGQLPQPLSEVLAWGSTDSQVLAITESGGLLRGTQAGWSTLRAPRPRTPVTQLRSHVALGEESVVILSQQGKLFLRSSNRSGVEAIPDEIDDFLDLRSLSDGRAIARRKSDDQATEILLIDEKLSARLLESFRVIEGPVDPQLLDSDRRVLSSIDGESLWKLEDARVKLQKIRQIKDAGDGRRAFLLDSEGVLAEVALDQIGSRVLAEFNPTEVEELAIDLDGEPAVITNVDIKRNRKPPLVRALDTNAVALDRGIAWLDDARRLRLDDQVVEHLLEKFVAEDRIEISVDDARRFTAGTIELVGDGVRHWRIDATSTSLQEIDFVPQDGMRLHAANEDSRVLIETTRGRSHLLAKNVDAEIPPGPGNEAVIIPFQESIISISTRGNSLFTIDCDQKDLDWAAFPLDPTPPPQLGAVFPLRSGEICVGLGLDGSLWRRSGFRNWRPIAAPKTLPDPAVTTLEVRESSEIATREFVISRRETGQVIDAWVFSEDRLMATMRQGDGLAITPTGRGTERIESERLGNAVENPPDSRPESIDPDLWSVILRSLDAIASEPSVAPTSLSASGLVESIDQLHYDIDGQRLAVWVSSSLKGAEVPDQILELSGNTGWSSDFITSIKVPGGGQWANLGSKSLPIWVRRIDGLLRQRAPLDIRLTGPNTIQVSRFDGSKIQIQMPVPEILPQAFKLQPGNNGSISYLDGEEWKTFRRGDYPFSNLDTPARDSRSLAHLETVGTWIIDRNDDLWFQEWGASTRTRLPLPGDDRAKSLDWTEIGPGQSVLTVKTGTKTFRVLPDRVDERLPTAVAPARVPLMRAGLEWRHESPNPFFGGKPVQLRGLAFDHEIPTGIVVDAGSIRADVIIDGSPQQRILDTRSGELTGLLLSPKKASRNQPQTVLTPAGEMSLDQDTGKITLLTPRLNGGQEFEMEWSPSQGAFEVDSVHRMLPVRDGWIQLTPEGLVLGVTLNFSKTTVLSNTGAPIATDLRPSADQSVDVKRSDGSTLRLDSIAAPPRVVQLNQTAFSEDAMQVQVSARRVATRAFAKRHGVEMKTPPSLEWIPDQGAFSFEIVNPKIIDDLATTVQGREILAPTMSGLLWLDRQGQVRPEAPNIKPIRADPVARTRTDTIQLDRSDFSSGPPQPNLSFLFPGEAKERLQIPWKLEDGLLPHRTFTAVAPLGPKGAGGFSRVGVHRFVEGRFTPPVLRFGALREKPTILLTDGFDACQAQFEDASDAIKLTAAGTIQRTQDNLAPTSASRIQVVPGHTQARIRRSVAEGRRTFELFIQGESAHEPLQLTEDGFLLDRTETSTFDADGRLVFSSDDTTLFRIEDNASCLDARIIHQGRAGATVELGFADPILQTAILNTPDGKRLPISKNEVAPFAEALDTTAQLRRLQPFDANGDPIQQHFIYPPSSQNDRVIQWHRGDGRPVREMVERNGIFDHDRLGSAARIISARSDRTDLVVKGTDSLAWRNGETGALIDVLRIPVGLEDTPLVSTDSGDWHIRQKGRWHPLVLDDQSSCIRMEAAGLRSLPLGFETPDWVWQWSDQPEVMDRESGRIWSPANSSWLRGDQIRAFIGEGPDRLYTTDTGTRVSSQTLNDGQTGVLTGPNPKSVRTTLGTMFISEDKTSLVSFSEGMIKTFPREDAVLEAAGDQLRISISENSMPSIGWNPPPDDPTDTLIDLPFPFTSFEGDHVLACATIADKMIALTPLGFFDTQSPSMPENGPALGRDGRKVISPGLVWLESEGGRPERGVVSDEPGGYRVQEDADSTRYELDVDFTMSESTIALFDDSRWALVRRFESGSWTDKFLDQARGLEMDAALGIHAGQLRFDRVLGLGIDKDGPWIWTEVAEERLDTSGQLMPARLLDQEAIAPTTNPSAAPYSRQIADMPGTQIHLPEFDLVINSESMELLDGTPAAAREDGDRIFWLPFGVLLVDEDGGLRWIRNQKKWFPRSHSDRRVSESPE